MWTGDTIVAVSSAPPPARRVVLRISGPDALAAARNLSAVPHLRGVTDVSLRIRGSSGGGVSVPAVVSVFRGPSSYTGEDVVEIGVPGSPWVVQALMASLLAVPGVRQAEPGEFTARAFLAGKLDLTAAEGVAAAIAAADQRQLDAARQLRSGQLVREITPLTDRLAELLALVEAGIDFSDEDVRFITPSDLATSLDEFIDRLASLLTRGRQFGVLTATPRIVLTGPPNAGKSTLLNRLTGQTRAVTSPVAGTTRDVLEARLKLPRGEALLTDTAGLAEAPPTDDIESQMVAAARSAVAAADLVVRVIPLTHGHPSAHLGREPDLLVHTMADLAPATPPTPGSVVVSAHTGQGIPDLTKRLDELCFGRPGGDGLALTTRHIAHLRDALDTLTTVRASLAAAADVDELTAASLREALTSLGHISGAVSPDDVLGKVFATFCIGK